MCVTDESFQGIKILMNIHEIRTQLFALHTILQQKILYLN